MKQETIRLQTRADAARLLLDMIRPLKDFYSPGKAFLNVSAAGVHYGRKIAGMEGFARILWGLGPLWHTANPDLPEDLRQEAAQWQELCITGIQNGTDPNHPEYWGDIHDFDQRMVEMAALAVAISLSPQKLYRDFSPQAQKNLYEWLNQINFKKVHGNNWRYFRILVNTTFRLLGLEWSEACVEDDLALIRSCYTGDGWYYDGNDGQIDYYVAFAIHFYSLIRAKLLQDSEPEFYQTTLEKGNQFCQDFIYWFANDGAELPFGRSLTYRFAHNSFFGALAFAGGEGAGYGVLKNLVLRNLESWLKRPIFDNAGVLSVGYHYPNLFMSENYNGGGSPYWALKSFIMLALPAEHPFWAAPAEKFSYQPQKKLSHAQMLITHDENHHVQAFTVDQHCAMDHGACVEKYEKFVYSNQFGFSVSRGNNLAMGAFDSVLAVSRAEEEFYRVYAGRKQFSLTEEWIRSEYEILPGVTVMTWLVPGGSWHVRIHRLKTAYPVKVADGGYAIENEDAAGEKYSLLCRQEENGGVFVSVPGGISGIVSLSGGNSRVIDAFPNTNLFYPLTVIPTVSYELPAGEHRLVDMVFADRSGQAAEKRQQRPAITDEGSGIRINFADNRQVWIDLA